MKSLHLCWIVVLLTFGCQTPRPQTNDVPNLAVVDAQLGIYRGGQPNLAGWGILHSLGITNVVKLNLNSEGIDYPEDGIVNRYPINRTQQFVTGPDTKEVWAAVHAMVPHTYVHCLHGQDRTGLVVGCYRLEHGISKTTAEQEMLTHGFHTELTGLWRWWNEEAQGTCPKP